MFPEKHRLSTSQINGKLTKIIKKTYLKTCWLLTSIFNDFGSILPPKLEAQKVVAFDFFDVFLQDRPKMVPRAPQRRPRAPQERPKSIPERPKSAQERPKSAQERPRATQQRPRVPYERPRRPREHKNIQKHAKTCKTMQNHATSHKNA